MKKLKSVKRISLVLLIITLLLSGTPVYAAESADNIAYTTYDSETEWQYKIIGSHLYRRLYDKTSNTWIGDWELVY